MALPDVELLVVQYLTEVTGLYACTVRPDGTEFSSHLPLVQITRTGGPRTLPTWRGQYVAEDARFSVDVFAASRQAANQTVSAVRLALEGLKGAIRDGGAVSRVWEEIGPAARPEEPNTDVVRIGWITGMTVRPA